MWRRVLSCLIIVLLALAGADLSDAATKKKKTKKAAPAPAIVKPMWEAPMRVVIVRSASPSCEPLCPEWIAAEGEITGATPAAFSKVFKQIGKRKLPVIIRSPGGSINAALEIGRMIRKRGLDVSLGWTSYYGCAPDQKSCKLPPEQKGIYRGLVLSSRAFCNSACPIIMAGGVTRLAPSDSYVGVHQPKTIWSREIVTYRERYRIVKGKKKIIDRKIVGRKPGKAKVTYGHDKALRKKLTAYYKEMGVDPKILDEAEKTKYKDIDYLTPAEVQQFNLRTSPAGPETLVGPKACDATPVAGNCAKGEGNSKTHVQTKNADRLTGLAEVEPSVRMPTGRPMKLRFVRNSSSACEPLCPEWISAKGVITKETPLLVESLLTLKRAAGLPIVIESEGGDFDASMAVAEFLRKGSFLLVAGQTELVSCLDEQQKCGDPALTAMVTFKGVVHNSSICYGACAVAFAGGTRRLASSLQFHNPKTYSTASRMSAATQLHALFGQTGVKPHLLQTMHSIQPGTTKNYWSDDLDESHMITSIVRPSVVSSTSDCRTGFAVCVRRN